MKDKLIELICEELRENNCEAHCNTKCFKVQRIADHLIANGVTVAEWIPVSERLPDDGQLAIVTYIRYDNGEPASDGIAYRDRGYWYWRGEEPEDDEEVVVEITHWMPLPKPPKGE